MSSTLMVFQAIISVLLIVVVLLQFGKGAEAGLLGGGGASDAVFSGSQQGNILSKITVFLAVLFLGNSILLARIQSTSSEKSLLDGEAPVAVPLNSDANAKKEVPVAKPESPEKTK